MTGTGKNGASRESDLESNVANVGNLDSVDSIGWVGLRLLLEKSPAILWTTDRELRLQRSLGSGLFCPGTAPG